MQIKFAVVEKTSDYKAALALAHLLDGLPLTLEQAVAYIQEKRGVCWLVISRCSEWVRLYERLVPIKCRYNEKKRATYGTIVLYNRTWKSQARFTGPGLSDATFVEE